MNRLTAALLLCFGLVLVTWRSGPASAQPAADKGQIYEDIEIMGRILDRVLKLPRHSTTAVPVYAQNPWFGGVPDGLGLGGLGVGGLGGGMPSMQNPYMTNTIVPSYLDPMPGQAIPNVYQTGIPQAGFGGGLGFGGGSFGGFAGGGGHMVSVPIPAYPKTQGTYLKDHGVVFMITLPPPPSDPKPRTIPALPKAPSEWERVRQQLRGEKQQASPKKPKAQEPSVADLVLEALAKNGHHLPLGEKENVTVSIIFRSEERQADGEQTVAGPDPEANPLASGGDGAGGGANAGKNENQSSGGGGPPAEPSTPRDYELLGDLHLKQGQSKDALKAYQQAAEKDPDPKHAAAIYLKMAQISLTTENNKAEADKALERAVKFLAKVQAVEAKKEASKPKKPASPLPSRLIITASKDLLDRAGREQIALDEFKKAATVEYLTFSPR